MATDQMPELDALRRNVDDSIAAALNRVDSLFDAARPDSAFAAPLTIDGRTIIGATEALLFAGAGAGGGAGQPQADEKPAVQIDGSGFGVGGGGGGAAYSRPVAVVIIDPNGVRVEPVVDATKIGLAALTVLGSTLFMLGRLWSMNRKSAD